MLNVAEYMVRWEGGVPRQAMEAPHPLPHTVPYASPPSGCSLVVYSFMINRLSSMYFPELGEPFQQIIEPTEEVRGTPNL